VKRKTPEGYLLREFANSICVFFGGVDGEGFASFEYESEISFGYEIMTRGHCEIFGVSPNVK